MSFNRKNQRVRQSQSDSTSDPMEQEMVDFKALREASEQEARESAATLDRFARLKAAFTGTSGDHNDMTYCQLNNREPLPLATLASLAGTSRGMHELFQPVVNHRRVVQLAQEVVYGNEDRVLQLLQANPERIIRLIETKVTVSDYSKRKVDHATPFQMALRAGDEVMAERMKVIYLEANPENGQAELEKQFKEVFPKGYAHHLKKQRRHANIFEREYLNPLVKAITEASPEDLQAALDHPDDENDISTLRQALNRFRKAFHDLSLQEKVYNPNHLLKSFEKYNAKFNAWYVNDDNPHRWLRLDLCWRQVIGWEQRYMTANYAQAFCTGLYNMVVNAQPLKRTLCLDNSSVARFFPLADTAFKLGFHFGVCSGGLLSMGGRGVGARSARGAEAGRLRYKTYVEKKQQTWEHYAARIKSSRSAECLIQ